MVTHVLVRNILSPKPTGNSYKNQNSLETLPEEQTKSMSFKTLSPVRPKTSQVRTNKVK